MTHDRTNGFPDLVIGGLGLIVWSQKAERNGGTAASELSARKLFAKDLVTEGVDFDTIVCGAKGRDDTVFDNCVGDDGFDAFHAEKFVCDDRDGVAL